MRGKATSLGREINIKEPIIVPKSKVVVLNVIETSMFKIRCGVGGIIEEVEDIPIPIEWHSAIKKVLDLRKPLKIMVLGSAESGKSVLSTFIANEAFSRGYKTAVIDSDVGQSDFGLPATISVGFLERKVTFLSEIPISNVFFLGSTSPKDVSDLIILNTKKAVELALNNGAEVAIINTDGWTSDLEAKKFKTSLIMCVEPNIILSIQKLDEIESIIKQFKGSSIINVFRFLPPKTVKMRSKEERRSWREHAFTRLFSDAKIKVLNFNRLSFMYSLFGSGFPLSNNEIKKYESLLNTPIVYGEATTDFIFLVCRGSIDKDTLQDFRHKVLNESGKDIAIVVDENFAKNLLVGILNSYNEFLGFGIIKDIDFHKKTISILTSVENEISAIAFGSIKLDENYREIGKVDPWSFS
ncbi:MAG: Clp1/GlmU family protein [Candidatus Methanomethylicia archaeon]|nr:Clp1/GlmU family protein [Candidatus Methanomethylicia archaeon]MCX8169105.1 Clp1/GlmU family protein [Candidatus Methanomethylicia archaeon]MDW7988837.1 Clp1/GlmU family protein [Nitrososphaerota archaeon]